MQRQADPFGIGKNGLRRVEGDARLAVRDGDVHRDILRQAGAVGRWKPCLQPDFIGLPMLEAGHAEVATARLQTVVDTRQDIDIGSETARLVTRQGCREGETSRGHRSVRLHGHVEVIDRVGRRRGTEQGGRQEKTQQTTPDLVADHLSPPASTARQQPRASLGAKGWTCNRRIAREPQSTTPASDSRIFGQGSGPQPSRIGKKTMPIRANPADLQRFYTESHQNKIPLLSESKSPRTMVLADRLQMSDAPRPSFDPDADQVQVDADVSSERPAISSEPHRHAALLDQDYRILLEAVSEYAVYRLTVDGVVSSWNRGAERNKGYSSTEAIGLHFSSFYTPEDQAAGEPARALHMARDSKVDTYGWRVRKDGSRFWAHVVIEAIRSPEGDILGFAKVTCDVTAQKLDRDLLVRDLDAALSNMSQGLCLFDPEERIVLSNQRMGEMFGLATADFAPGTLFADLLSSIVSRGGPTQDLYDGVTGTYDHHRRLITQPGGGTAVLKVGPDRVFAITHRSMADTSWVTTFADISERMKTENQIAHMALHDGLTELPNRLMFHQRLNEALRRVKRGETCAVLCLDLDRFKTVNDTLGHPVGDQLLVAIARKLKDLVRDTDTVARLGGDEFAIVLSNFKKTTDTTDLAGRLIRALNQPHDVGGHLVVTGVSIGIALAPDDGVDPDQLLKCADLALYRAKSGGRGRYCYFEPEMDALLQQRRLLELDLRTALPAREFELYYQPIVNIERDEVCGFEALLRWHSPRRGMVSPIDFIPLAEEIGLIVDIGRWVLETACREATLWPDHIKVAGQCVGGPVQGFPSGRSRRIRPDGDWTAAEPARDRDHRVDHDRGQQTCLRRSLPTEEDGFVDLDGRLRDRVFVARLPPQFPFR